MKPNTLQLMVFLGFSRRPLFQEAALQREKRPWQMMRQNDVTTIQKWFDLEILHYWTGSGTVSHLSPPQSTFSLINWNKMKSLIIPYKLPKFTKALK